MWLMPSFGRPQALRKLLEAPGGWPDKVWVLVNGDDPEKDRYFQLDALLTEADAAGKDWRRDPPWVIQFVPKGSRFCEAVRFASMKHPGEPFYGIVDDDYWPVTPGWHETMVAAAGPNAIAIANNRQNFPKPYCCRVMGGELARAIGTIAPGTMRHNFSDDTWGRFAEDFGLLRPLEDVIVEHRHHLFTPEVKKDATYDRGSGDFAEDKRRYEEWLQSDERRAQCERVAKLVGGAFTVWDPSKVHLAVAVLSGDSRPDMAFHHSYTQMIAGAVKRGMRVTTFYTCGASHIGKARERVLWNAMAAPATHLLFIDDDMGWDENLPFRLLAADVDFACAVGVKKIDEPSLCCNFYPGEQVLHPVNRFVKLRDVGFAFVLLKRAVIERMVAAYPELAYNAGPGKTEHALFLDMIEDRERLSEDYSFCRRWTAIGGEIWADRKARLIHAGRKEYSGSIDDLFRGQERVNMDLVQAA